MISHPNGERMSRSERERKVLQDKLVALEMMKDEYMILCHYLVAQGGGTFDVERDKVIELGKAGVLKKGIRSEDICRDSDGKRVLRMTVIDQQPEQPQIIIPG